MVNASWMNASPPWMHVFANEGFIIATVDNRGSANRGLSFENVIHRQLGQAEMADQLQLIDWLKEKPYVATLISVDVDVVDVDVDVDVVQKGTTLHRL